MSWIKGVLIRIFDLLPWTAYNYNLSIGPDNIGKENFVCDSNRCYRLKSARLKIYSQKSIRKGGKTYAGKSENDICI